jgi:hypothetical protein
LPQPLEVEGAGASLHRPASRCTELPRQDSNLNKENQNQNAPQCKTNSESTLGNASPAGRSAGRSDLQTEGEVTDPELAALMVAWPTLSDPIRAAIQALLVASR